MAASSSCPSERKVLSHRADGEHENLSRFGQVPSGAERADSGFRTRAQSTLQTVGSVIENVIVRQSQHLDAGGYHPGDAPGFGTQHRTCFRNRGFVLD